MSNDIEIKSMVVGLDVYHTLMRGAEIDPENEVISHRYRKKWSEFEVGELKITNNVRRTGNNEIVREVYLPTQALPLYIEDELAKRLEELQPTKVVLNQVV